jgi:hypothetical protein
MGKRCIRAEVVQSQSAPTPCQSTQLAISAYRLGATQSLAVGCRHRLGEMRCPSSQRGWGDYAETVSPTSWRRGHRCIRAGCGRCPAGIGKRRYRALRRRLLCWYRAAHLEPECWQATVLQCRPRCRDLLPLRPALRHLPCHRTRAHCISLTACMAASRSSMPQPSYTRAPS